MDWLVATILNPMGAMSGIVLVRFNVVECSLLLLSSHCAFALAPMTIIFTGSWMPPDDDDHHQIDWQLGTTTSCIPDDHSWIFVPIEYNYR
jgi:hypothetical protein